jgi:hypothetical protein
VRLRTFLIIQDNIDNDEINNRKVISASLFEKSKKRYIFAAVPAP